MKQKVIVGITGASGAIYARKLLGCLHSFRKQIEEVGLVMTENARKVWEYELGDKSYEELPFKVYDKMDFDAPFASGSAKFNTMIICPCSMGTLGRIANGFSDDLLTRAADVVLKERRKLILVARDMPYGLIHIENMRKITLAGGIVCPANPHFYSQPKTIDALAATVVDRVIDLAGLDQKTFRWGE